MDSRGYWNSRSITFNNLKKETKTLDVISEMVWKEAKDFRKHVDFGCGKGAVINRLENDFKERYHTGIETSELMLDQLRSFSAVMVDLNRINSKTIEGLNCDLFTMRNVLHTLDNAYNFIKRLTEATKEGDIFIISEPIVPKCNNQEEVVEWCKTYRAFDQIKKNVYTEERFPNYVSGDAWEVIDQQITSTEFNVENLLDNSLYENKEKVEIRSHFRNAPESVIETFKIDNVSKLSDILVSWTSLTIMLRRK